MKLPLHILSFYLLILSLIPCCVWDDCPDEKTAGIETTDHQSGDDDDCGTCSPFFSCAGCASIISLPETIPVITTIDLSTLPLYADYQSDPPCALPLDVWQPPRL